MDAAVKNGVQRITADVSELVYDNAHVSGVKTADGQHLTADKILLATGAWTSALLSPVEDTFNIPHKDRIERQLTAVGQVSAYYTVSAAEAEALAGRRPRTPVIVYGDRGEMVPPSTDNKTIKITNYRNFSNPCATGSGTTISMPPGRDGRQADVPGPLQRETEALAAKILPAYLRDRKPDRWRVCWDAYTPKQDWLLCRHPHPRLGNVYVASGGSFHGYKFLPNCGKYVCNVLFDRGNGAEKDRAWGWKEGGKADWEGVHPKGAPRRELREMMDEGSEGEKARL